MDTDNSHDERSSQVAAAVDHSDAESIHSQTKAAQEAQLSDYIPSETEALPQANSNSDASSDWNVQQLLGAPSHAKPELAASLPPHFLASDCSKLSDISENPDIPLSSDQGWDPDQDVLGPDPTFGMVAKRFRSRHIDFSQQTPKSSTVTDSSDVPESALDPSDKTVPDVPAAHPRARPPRRPRGP